MNLRKILKFTFSGYVWEHDVQWQGPVTVVVQSQLHSTPRAADAVARQLLAIGGRQCWGIGV